MAVVASIGVSSAKALSPRMALSLAAALPAAENAQIAADPVQVDLLLIRVTDPSPRCQNRSLMAISDSGSWPGLGHASLMPLPMTTNMVTTWSAGRLISFPTAA